MIKLNLLWFIEKDFDRWGKRKVLLDKLKKTPPDFKIREIWWCSVGVNVGYEVYGKGYLFTRPVLILHRYSKQTFFGVPLSSKRKNTYYRYPFYFRDKEGDVLIDQSRSFDVRRLVDRIGRIDEEEFNRIKKAFRDLLNL